MVLKMNFIHANKGVKIKDEEDAGVLDDVDQLTNEVA